MCIRDRFYDEASRIGIVNRTPHITAEGTIVVATGGTSDIPVAEEAALTAEVLGNKVVRVYDVGVAGLHRLLDVYKRQADHIRECVECSHLVKMDLL